MYVEKNSDFRIFASCTEEVKLIGKLADPVNAWGDYFLIPSSKNAGTQYTFAFPTADYYAKGAFAILPVNKEGSINVTFVGYAMGELFHSETFEYEIIPGHFQHYISCNIFESANLFDYNVSVSIITSSPVMLSFESPLTTLSNDDSSCGQSCNEDSVNFMPIASQPIVCDKPLVTPDQRMITNDFTTRLYVSPPSVETNCDASDTITVYDVINNVQGTKQEVSKFGFTAISLMNTEAAGFTTTSGQMSTNRFGSFFGASDHTTAFGNFMHYVPSISEWITGKSQFYTLAKNCYVELYTDSNEDAIIKIDGIEIDGYIFKEQNIQLFGKNYIQYVVDMYKYGIHTIENSGNYVAYVICSNVNGPNNAAGYLTGFNQRK
uniref:IgGFc_binding domain-containing protein n=1 Tax=Rhabditophanes sp. KR3021 TaxID=114890 RepID=A0AC35UE61_9BILA